MPIHSVHCSNGLLATKRNALAMRNSVGSWTREELSCAMALFMIYYAELFEKCRSPTADHR